jgi:two-component system sensor histidine kinase CpxA
MPRRFPLYAKILVLFALNLGLLAGMFYTLFRVQFHSGPDWLLSNTAAERIDALRDILLAELRQQPPAQWDETLARFESGYHKKVRFLAFDGRGAQLAGDPLDLPAEIRLRLAGPPGSPQRPRPMPLPPPAAAGEPRPEFMIHTGDPSRYWVIVRTRFKRPEGPRTEPLFLVLVSDTLGAGGLFFEIGPWIRIGLAAFAVSALLWFPLLRGINRSIAQMTHATRHIAEGRFDARVAEGRRDELGDLGRAINQMAARLAGLVAGQKRFLGDVAHELCSPLAKLRVSLGILEQRAGAEQRPYVATADEEAAHIAGLVNELLNFSKASLALPAAQLQSVNVRQTVETAVRRDAPAPAVVQQDIPADLTVTADAGLLARALGNLLRNAVRYAGECGPITVAAQRDGEQVRITVADRGPGVPAADLPRLFDPFYRADASRDRATGGVGLGLAIVKTCVETCGGAVTCRNRLPTGLEVTISLPSHNGPQRVQG